MALSPEFPLPLELLCEIIKLLPLRDLKTLSLVSRLTRSQAIHFIFRHLQYTANILPKVRNIHQATKDVKEVIKKLELSSYITIGKDEGSLVISRFLETLPSLRVLYVDVSFTPASLSQFISSIRHTALLELILNTAIYGPIGGPPTAGLTGLEKLSIRWYAEDNPNEPGSSLAHLYELIRPTLTTLVKFRIDFCGNFDLQLLKPSAVTLRSFEYTLQSADEGILDTIPEILPHLTKLKITWGYSFKEHSILWKEAHIQALSKNNNLTDLALSSDFEVNARDTLNHDFAWFARCYKRRLKATQDITSACPRLQRCSWVQMGIGRKKYCRIVTHSFIVEERMTGSNVTRVVRGIKRNWMDQDYWLRRGSIVDCKLEDLPGDIISPSWDYIDLLESFEF